VDGCGFGFFFALHLAQLQELVERALKQILVDLKHLEVLAVLKDRLRLLIRELDFGGGTVSGEGWDCSSKALYAPRAAARLVCIYS